MDNKGGGGGINISLFAGIGIAVALIVYGMLGGGSGDIMNFVDADSVFIVLGGTIGAVVASYPMDDLKKIPTLIQLAIKMPEMNYMTQIKEIIEMANIARKNGVLALEDRMNEIKDPFIKNGIALIVDGSDPELVKSMLNTQSYFTDERHAKYISIFETGSTAAPAFGMVGTLIGLINMLKNLSGDMSSIGPAMSVALITTLYGVLLANLIFNPIAKQLGALNSNELLCKDIIIEGILSIQDGENPRVIEDKLKAFVAQADMDAQTAAEGETATEGA